MHRFEDNSNWEERGIIEVGKDSAGKVLQVKVVNNELAASGSVKQDFENNCKKDNFY